MNFISLLDNRKGHSLEINKFDFHPEYCQKSNLVWNTLFRLSLNKEQNFFLELPRDIVIHISKFSLGINIGEYQYYLNSLHSMMDNILFYARNGNRRGFNLCHQQIENLLNTLKSKIAYAQVTHKDLFYVGSITIDANIMQQANLAENERVDIVNLNNGERLTTYVITGEAGSGIFALNGPAARRCEIGDTLFILSYAMINPQEEHLDPTLIDLKHKD